ncbi:hypothetical protein [Pseudalkalibacillus berkeleyi]|uniref:Uncharacterized protein n=1 Tax=Pseudalkalibacillus berkeleyi TaxID=1069813 RepID=A0ABS9GZQ3_9BACL|nr:hypothetical protein [Pseudalkalibacillus berkeleyi]MCF6136885.1 hypothetical protein [Pseudalkalibacillus berkeleyi]
MASTKLVWLRMHMGMTLTEVVVEASDMIFTNVEIIEAGNDWTVIRQSGSGGLGDVWIPTQNIACIIM